MASHRIGELGLSESGPSSHHHIPYGVLHGINTSASSLINQGSAFDFGELEEAIVLHGVKGGNDESKASLFTGRPAATLEMFPSWPMRFQQTPRGGSKSGGESTDSALSSKTEPPFEAESPISKKASCSDHQAFFDLQQLRQEMASDAPRTASTQNQSAAKSPQEKRKGAGSTSEKPLDAKTLRRLAQNREAARKSRLRKKAYVQQLESSRLKLTQLEQELQRARSQGLFVDCGGVGSNVSSGAAMFDMEYARWLEEEQRLMGELRNGLQAPLSDSDMRVMVDGYLSHYDDIFRLKAVTAKSDVFHLINGMWTSQAERCFLWIGGFRPSDLITMLIQQLEPLAEQQIMGMYGLRHSSQQAEEALSQGLEQLQQSLVDTIAGGPVVDGVQQMVVAMGKLANLEGFVRQADNLRQQTLHQLCRLLTVRQAARCFIVIGEYYARLRALSSLWASRPRETLISDDNSCQTTTEMQIVQHSQNHFSSF
ncbi:transcription factor TGA9 isoform X2 [Cajanus cajan]|uniref:TGACG-sequence-specific DNA-binding protein TGA-2.1 n=1 Tax=Cajanus cajan TaxID=3821 RepID=A0A151RN10_CAJCA|nr:transcription factor TGA9 isoform X2 [Cajanus cajan]KYP43908.1 TGACG-sequence-specific DNA-binding protein TGA-2.1 [Cajanus cajan]